MRKVENFVERAIAVYGDRFDFSKTEYINSRTKVCVICPKHGEFWTNPKDFLYGHACPYCANEKRGREVIDTRTFIEKARKIHGDKYDYSKVDYKNAMDGVIIICPVHGEFVMMPNNHINQKQGCPKCAGRKLNNEEWIDRFKSVHGNKYDYSKVKFIDNEAKVCIICPEHGEFWQSPSKHYNAKQGCPKCGKRKCENAQKITKEEYIEKARKVHGGKYDYSKIEYDNSHSKITIICPKHGEFQQLAYDHTNGHGCPVCANLYSSKENEIYGFLVKKLGEENVIQHDRIILGGRKELDIYVPSLKLAIEYNGLYWHSEATGKDKWYHYDKMKACEDKGIRLIEIFEDEYLNHKDIVINKLLHLIGKDNNKEKIGGRKCTVRRIENKEAEIFLEKYHLQGYGKATICYGAFFNEKLIGVMTFIKWKDNEWELNRFATSYDYVCQGVGGKLFRSFVQENNPDYIKSFADRRWSSEVGGNIYEKIGFKKEEEEAPDYCYLNLAKPDERIHKFNMRKQTLSKKYDLPMEMTENEMVEELGYTKIWNCGLIKYSWRKQEKQE